MNQPSQPFDPRTFLSQLTTQPGVYRMYDKSDELLYVGKARNLRKRVGSYFLRASGNPRIESMVGQICRVEVTLTHTEDEALLLEAALIKEQTPRYNVSLRDDKSFPYVRITAHAYPRIAFYRGAKTGPDQYFGPYPSAGSVRETLQTLQKLFLLRPCNDTFFSNRRRPCLQHQIKRCSAPCVKLISEEDYAHDVAKAVRLLEGRGDELAHELGAEMEQASAQLEFELAARLRDQIAALNRVREHRAITGGAEQLDVIAAAQHVSNSCVVVVSVRDGINLGHGSFFPRHPPGMAMDELLSGFIAQYYLERPPPPELLVSELPEDAEWLEATLSAKAGRKVRIARPERGVKQRLMEMAAGTAQQALSTRMMEAASMDQRLLELQQALDLEQPPRRMECFDISHTMGEKAVASCVVFNEEGPLKAAYRKFNIEGITPGDDYAAIKQAVARRYARIKGGEVQRPDVLFIDGGKGQLGAAMEALGELEIENLRVVAIAKGPTRRPGLEQLILPEQEQPLVLAPDSPALHLIQRIRDEAHRFAITGHRARREKARLTSGLEVIEGLGPARRRALLKTLGGLPQVKRAGVDELARVEGISRTLAERIYAHFH
ncbi:excinuclease ABC subunit UvrC [Nevskia soli]|uniref:excinuclease ABC subunit UvrC n=1 Tax=Nevskia soli TaxID=418856 RepID=UPI0004A73E50|nr:excinuclease ABC subunit UvrC [Nevskia soli]